MTAQEIDLRGWALQVDAERTREFYDALPYLSCDCGDCQNFIAAYDLLPADVRSVFDALGIDPRKEGGEVYSYVHHDDGSTMYGGVMLFVGEVLEEPAGGFAVTVGETTTFNETSFADTLAGGFTREDSLVNLTVPERPDPSAVFQFTLDSVPQAMGRDEELPS